MIAGAFAMYFVSLVWWNLCEPSFEALIAIATDVSYLSKALHCTTAEIQAEAEVAV